MDNNDTDTDGEPLGIADALMSRGEYFRQLRLMEEEDLKEREQQEQKQQNNDEIGGSYCDNNSMMSSRKGEEQNGGDEIIVLSSTNNRKVTVLKYESYLNHQRYYDDLKHIDCTFIDYGIINGTTNNDSSDKSGGGGDGGRLIIEQDKSLGKGGLCWDAAFILGEYVICNQEHWRVPSKEKTSMVELGTGTGLCGLMVAKAIKNCHVNVTDLPELMHLLVRNVKLNFHTKSIISTHSIIKNEDNIDDVTSKTKMKEIQSYLTDSIISGGGSSTMHTNCDNMNAEGLVSASVLRWGEEGDYNGMKYDVIFGADIVASLYDPIALARTIHSLCHEASIIYISYKGRLSGPHETFEKEINNLFASIDRIKPSSCRNRNKNPDVMILKIQSAISQRKAI